jgi:hypothetical protein
MCELFFLIFIGISLPSEYAKGLKINLYQHYFFLFAKFILHNLENT